MTKPEFSTRLNNIVAQNVYDLFDPGTFAEFLALNEKNSGEDDGAELANVPQDDSPAAHSSKFILDSGQPIEGQPLCSEDSHVEVSGTIQLVVDDKEIGRIVSRLEFLPC